MLMHERVMSGCWCCQPPLTKDSFGPLVTMLGWCLSLGWPLVVDRTIDVDVP